MEDLIYKAISGAFIAVVSSFITVRLSLRKFRTEKWWERKAEAYAKVIEALYQSKRFTDRHLEEAYGERELSEEYKKELLQAAKVASAEIDRVANIGAFLLSEKAMERIAKYKKDEKHATDTRDWHEHLDREWGAISSCLTDMVAIAKEDLEVKPVQWPWWRGA